MTDAISFNSSFRRKCATRAGFAKFVAVVPAPSPPLCGSPSRVAAGEGRGGGRGRFNFVGNTAA